MAWRGFGMNTIWHEFRVDLEISARGVLKKQKNAYLVLRFFQKKIRQKFCGENSAQKIRKISKPENLGRGVFDLFFFVVNRLFGKKRLAYRRVAMVHTVYFT